MTRLFVSVEMRHGENIQRLTRDITDAAEHEPDGSGCGGGYRDLDFTVRDEAEADATVNRIISAYPTRDVQWFMQEG